MSAYSIDRTLDCCFPDAVERVKGALKEQGFGTLSEIDVRATLREKIGKEIAGYTILGVCNPHFAAQAIEAEENIGVFLPCTVLVRETARGVKVLAQDPTLLESFIGNPRLGPLSQDVKSRIVSALDTLSFR